MYFTKLSAYSKVPNKRAARLLIFSKNSSLHGLIRDCTFIFFHKNFLPAHLFLACTIIKLCACASASSYLESEIADLNPIKMKVYLILIHPLFGVNCYIHSYFLHLVSFYYSCLHIYCNPARLLTILRKSSLHIY